MAKLSQFKRNTKAFTEGTWKRPDPGSDLEILSRGYTDTYYDAQASKQRAAAKGFNGDTEKLPVAIKRRINIDCLIAHVLVDVRGLEGEDGKPVSFATFCDLIRDPDYSDLANAAFAAASMVTNEREADLADTEGNSSPASAGTSNGASIATS